MDADHIAAAVLGSVAVVWLLAALIAVAVNYHREQS